MRIAGRPFPVEEEVVRLSGDLEESSRPERAARPPMGNSFNLARPWKFPAGHADSILCRRHPRSAVQVPVEISLVRLDGTSYDRGTGVILDLSYSGLRLGDVFLSRGRLLAMCCWGVKLRPALEAPGGRDIAGRILRTSTSGRPGFGIEFLVPGSGAQERFREIRRGVGGREATPPLRP